MRFEIPFNRNISASMQVVESVARQGAAEVRTIESTVTLDFLGNLQRTHMCGDLRASNAQEHVVVMGWVNRRRDHGNLIFLDLRDRSGITQVVLDKELA